MEGPAAYELPIATYLPVSFGAASTCASWALGSPPASSLGETVPASSSGAAVPAARVAGAAASGPGAAVLPASSLGAAVPAARLGSAGAAASVLGEAVLPAASLAAAASGCGAVVPAAVSVGEAAWPAPLLLQATRHHRQTALRAVPASLLTGAPYHAHDSAPAGKRVPRASRCVCYASGVEP
jgi:hypothetical protein